MSKILILLAVTSITTDEITNVRFGSEAVGQAAIGAELALTYNTACSKFRLGPVAVAQRLLQSAKSECSYFAKLESLMKKSHFGKTRARAVR